MTSIGISISTALGRGGRVATSLPAPSNLVLSVTGAGFDVITATWDAVTGATDYEVEYSDDGVTYVPVGTTALLTFDIEDSDYDVDAAVHYVRVRAAGGDDWVVATISGLLIGLLHYWSLDEASGTRVDSISGKNLTVLNGTPGSAAGKIGNAATFSDAEFGQLGSAADVSLGDPFTLAWWQNITALTGVSTVGLPNDLVTRNELSGGTLRLFINTFATNITRTGLTTGTWQNVITKYDGTTVSLRLDNGTPATTNTTITPAVNKTFLFGNDGGAGTMGFALDIGLYWNRALSPAQEDIVWSGGAGWIPT